MTGQQPEPCTDVPPSFETCGGPLLSDLFKRCQTEQTQYDYDGLSNTVLVERRGPYQQDICATNFPATPSDDRFLSSYTYGRSVRSLAPTRIPTGTRTAPR